MIKVIKELELSDFKAWSGGACVLENSIDNGTYDELSDYIQDYINSKMEDNIDGTELNDILWFDDQVQKIVYGNMND
ncbi:hypothetical protein [Liquorilactobacillus hordei]|uniref:Uncharacterized protein n=1 Tax=Liquorilactobacillus hordei DSM 19519 TaxID=1423759 RepID=A0A0R1MSA1_9LACO|nr:hypothetical protein [Liquorilactobacillus hordei]KRL08050.1 hypothetical protein FC92_GL001124 [Liquorilactobacillus hordei DSM 19519]QYH51006.1 hypothetical protein G6O70_00125 [Liquorilactobacillus hordei DSM 19519]